jgi:hypothetical protein
VKASAFPSWHTYITPTTAVDESDGFLCENEAERNGTKNDAVGNPLDVLVMLHLNFDSNYVITICHN